MSTLALEEYLPGGRVFKAIQTAQECGLASAGGSDDHHLLPFANALGDVVQHEQIAELLGEVDHLDDGLAELCGRGGVRGQKRLILHIFILQQLFCHSWQTSFR